MTHAIVFILLLCAGVTGSLYLLQESMIFPGRGQSESQRSWALDHYPGSEVSLDTPDGEKLHGWFVRNGGPEPLPLLMYFGGNAEDVSYNLRDVHRVPGWAVLMMSYRGYGLSSGRPGEAGFFRDALYLYDTFTKRPDVDASRVVVMGRSLGTGVAVHVAAERPAAGVVLVSPFDSAAEVARGIWPFLPMDLLIRHRFDSASRAGRIEAPLLVLLAEHDDIIPHERSLALVRKWGGSVKIVTIRDVDHNTFQEDTGYWDSISSFLGQTGGERAPEKDARIR